MNKNVLELLNSQMNFEIESAHIYLAIAGYFGDLGLEGFENFFMIQYEEELFHAKKLMKYITSRGERVNIKGFSDPVNEYKSPLDAFETSLKHEKVVTERVNAIAAEAQKANDFATSSFIKWFIDEQVEEEATFDGIVNKIKFLDNVGLYILDQEMKSRTFTPPAL